MPFDNQFGDVFHYGIRPVVSERGLDCVRVDKDIFVGEVLGWIHRRIDRAEVMIADMTGANPNVYYEVGYAQHAGKPIVLVCSTHSSLAFNVQNVHCLFYENIEDLESKLANELDGLLLSGRA
jgi:hypothetical protein